MHIEGAEPFLLPGGGHGVLLIHGFTGLPAELRLLGEYLRARGFTVLAVRLAGHGTSVEDLSRMRCEDWMDSVRDGYAILRALCGRISLVGHSMGAIFAMLLSLETEVSRVVSLGAPLMIAPERGIEHLPPRAACVGRYMPKAHRKVKDVPRGANNTYRQMPLISIHEVMAIIACMKERIGEVTAPLLVMHGARDHTADPRSAEMLCAGVRSTHCEKWILPDAGHLLPLDAGIRERIFERTAAFLSEDAAHESEE